MERQVRWVAKVATSGLLWLGLAAHGAAEAAPWCTANAPTVPPCIPNAKTFGYFETQWREWPGQAKPELVFPGSVGREILQTPPGQEEVPPPKATPLPSKPPAGGAESNPGPLPPSGPSSKEQEPSTVPLVPDVLPLPGTMELSKPETPKSKESTPAKPGEKPLEMPAEKPANPPAGNLREKSDEPASPSKDQPGSGGGLPGLTPLEKLTPSLLPALPPPDATRPAVPKPIDGGSLDPRKEDAPVAAAAHPGVTPLRADWASSLDAESLGTGELRLAGAAEEVPDRGGQYALGGFCPVQLCQRGCWVPGDARFRARYHGRIYVLSGPEEQKRFLAAPSRYAPACDGNDPVVAAEEGQRVPGRVDCSLIFNDRVYLFSTPVSLKQFRENPAQYAGAGR